MPVLLGRRVCIFDIWRQKVFRVPCTKKLCIIYVLVPGTATEESLCNLQPSPTLPGANVRFYNSSNMAGGRVHWGVLFTGGVGRAPRHFENRGQTRPRTEGIRSSQCCHRAIIQTSGSSWKTKFMLIHLKVYERKNDNPGHGSSTTPHATRD